MSPILIVEDLMVVETEVAIKVTTTAFIIMKSYWTFNKSLDLNGELVISQVALLYKLSSSAPSNQFKRYIL